MKRLILALQFLTRLPLPAVTATDRDFAASMRWFPAAGIVVGAVVAGAAWAGARLDPWIGALTALIAWVLVTGALHLDGLGDIADAAGAAHKAARGDREQLRAVLADPHVGSFGVVAIALQLIAKLVLLHALIEVALLPLLALVPAVARIAPLLWTRWLPPLHPGLAARFAGAVRPIHIALWTILFAIAAIRFAPALLAAPLPMLLWSWWLRHWIGGISGDGHGAGIELVETALLAALIIGAAV